MVVNKINRKKVGLIKHDWLSLMWSEMKPWKMYRSLRGLTDGPRPWHCQTPAWRYANSYFFPVASSLLIPRINFIMLITFRLVWKCSMNSGWKTWDGPPFCLCTSASAYDSYSFSPGEKHKREKQICIRDEQIIQQQKDRDVKCSTVNQEVI